MDIFKKYGTIILSVFECVCMEIRFTILLEMVDLFAQKVYYKNFKRKEE